MKFVGWWSGTAPQQPTGDGRSSNGVCCVIDAKQEERRKARIMDLRQWAIELLVPYVASEVLIDAADEIVKFVENGK